MRKRPLLIASVGFTFGVLYGPADFPWIDVIAGLLCLAIARRRQFRFPIMYWIFVWVGGFLLGLPVGSFALPRPETIEAPATLTIEGTVVETVDRGLLADGLVVDVTATATSATARFVPARGRVLLRVPHPAGDRHPTECAGPGRRLRTVARIEERQPSLVPAFRSRRLAVRRGVQLHAEAIGACTALDPASPRTSLSRALSSAILRTGVANAGLLGALATGDRSGAELGVEARLIHAGMGQLLELSGLGMALLFYLGLLVLRRVSKHASKLALPLLLLLILIFGATPSILRTALVLACLLIPGLDTLEALALAVIGVLALSPEALGDVRFQLGFAALSAVLRLYPAFAERIPRLTALPPLARAPLRLILIAIAVALGTAPLTARLFDRVSLLSLAAAPLAIVLAIAVIGPLSLAGGALAVLSPAAGAPLLSLASALLELLLTIVPSGEAASIPTPTVFECVLFYAVISASAAPTIQTARRRINPLRFAAVLSLILIAWTTASVWRASSGDALEAAVLPVQSGSAWVVRLPDGSVVVRDSAPPAAWFQMEQRVVSNHLKLRRHTQIETLMAEPGDDPAAALELGHQFPIREIRTMPVQGSLRFEHGGRSILFADTASTATGSDVAIVLPDGTVTSAGRTYRTQTNGMIRIRIDREKLEVIPLR